MVVLTNVLFGFFFILFSYGMIVARTRRQLLALALAGVLAVALVSPPPAQAQASLVTAIQSVLNVINGKIQTALTAINKVRSTIDNYYQEVVWPVALINQARSLVTQMIGQYRGLMQTHLQHQSQERHVTESDRARKHHAKSSDRRLRRTHYIVRQTPMEASRQPPQRALPTAR